MSKQGLKPGQNTFFESGWSNPENTSYLEDRRCLFAAAMASAQGLSKYEMKGKPKGDQPMFNPFVILRRLQREPQGCKKGKLNKLS